MVAIVNFGNDLLLERHRRVCGQVPACAYILEQVDTVFSHHPGLNAFMKAKQDQKRVQAAIPAKARIIIDTRGRLLFRIYLTH